MPMWMGSVPAKCDIKGEPITEIFIDGRTEFGPWAIMCDECHKKHGMGIGQGVGQKYMKAASGLWHKIDG